MTKTTEGLLVRLGLDQDTVGHRALAVNHGAEINHFHASGVGASAKDVLSALARLRDEAAREVSLARRLSDAESKAVALAMATDLLADMGALLQLVLR